MLRLQALYDNACKFAGVQDSNCVNVRSGHAKEIEKRVMCRSLVTSAYRDLV